MLEFVEEEFAEKVSASVLTISFYICDLSIIFNAVFEWSRLVFARNFADHFPDCVCFGGRIKFIYIILPTDLFSLFIGFPYLCSEQFKSV